MATKKEENINNQSPQKQLKFHFLDKFLKSKLGNKFNFERKDQVFTCPKCQTKPSSAVFAQGTDKIYCNNPLCKYSATILEVVYLFEPEKKDLNEAEIAKYLLETYSMKIPNLDVEFYLKAYEKFGFSLVPCIRNDKKPFEDEWQNKIRKDRSIWEKWIRDGFNVGVMTGKCSGITVVDFDDENQVPDIFKSFTTAIQKTNKGFHYLFAYDEELPNYNMRYNKENPLKIEILNDGKQFVAFPSKVGGFERNWNFKDYDFKIPKMSEAIKKFLLENSSNNKKTYSTEQEAIDQQIKEDIQNEDFKNVKGLEIGSRNHTLIKLGGILRKRLNFEQTGYVLRLFNKNFLQEPLPEKEVYAMLGSLDKYINIEEKDLALKILDYLKYAEEATSQDIVIALNEGKADIDKAISYLIRERYVARRQRTFHLLKKMRWRDDFPNIINEVPFKVPYFDDLCISNWGDMFILGGLPGTGKTTISMNILKRFIAQGIKPYYVCLESGSRFIKTACSLGITEKQINWVVETDPTKILVEPNSVTILDWLLIKDKAQTDTVLQHFSEQLVQTNSFLIVLMQLKKDGDWFAPNMIDQFPAFATRYLYEKDDQGNENRIFGHWKVDKIREARKQFNSELKIPCKYIWEDKTLLRLDELPDYNGNSCSDIIEV